MILAVIIASASGAVLEYYASPNSTQTVTLTSVNSQTTTLSIAVMRTTTQISFVSESYSMTVTVEKAVQAETITELFVIKSGDIGGSLFCGGNLSNNQCIGLGIEKGTVTTYTTFVFPSNATQRYFNATITQSTSYGTLSCGNYTTTTVTESYNKTSGIGSESITWSGTCL